MNPTWDLPTAPLLIGERLKLRAPQDGDKADRLVCGRDAEFRRMVGGDPRSCTPMTVEEVEGWYEQVASMPNYWVIEANGHCIGSARLHDLDIGNRRARYAIGIFDRSCWNQGFGTEATRLVLAYAFDVVGLHRVDLRVLDFNHRAIACYEKCGFVREGVEREGARIGEEWHTDIMMSILESEYRQRRRSNL